MMRLFFFFTLSLIYVPVASQSLDQEDCLILEVKDKGRMEVYIDSLRWTGLYYRSCEEPSIHKIEDFRMVMKVKYLTGQVHPMTKRIRSLKKANLSSNPKVPYWKFTNRTWKNSKVIYRGESIIVNYDEGGLQYRKKRGVLKTITAYQLIINDRNGVELVLDKDRVRRIRSIKRNGLLNAILITVGILALLLSLGLAVNSLDPGILRLGLGFALLLILGTFNTAKFDIGNPFGGKWQIEFSNEPNSNSQP